MVAALVLNALMLRTARQQRTVIGTLKAVGYADGQIFLHFLKFGLLIGLVGGLLGAVGGYFDTLLVTTVYSWYFQFPKLEPHNLCRERHRRNWHQLALCADRQHVWCMADAAAAAGGSHAAGTAATRVARFCSSDCRFCGIALSSGWRMTLRGILRNRFRTAMGLFSAAMGARC